MTGTNDYGDFYAKPVCVFLPSNDDAEEEYIYYEMTLFEWDEYYGEVAERVVSGTLSRNDIEANDDTMKYKHIKSSALRYSGSLCKKYKLF